MMKDVWLELRCRRKTLSMLRKLREIAPDAPLGEVMDFVDDAVDHFRRETVYERVIAVLSETQIGFDDNGGHPLRTENGFKDGDARKCVRWALSEVSLIHASIACGMTNMQKVLDLIDTEVEL